jgi:predicted TIM-barrel fold metal-dependent hydrolase
MPMPRDIPIVDTMIGFKHADVRSAYTGLRNLTRDRQTREEFSFPVEYIFKDVPDGDLQGDPIAVTLSEMDRHGVVTGLVSIGDETGRRAVGQHPTRFAGTLDIQPATGLDAAAVLRTAAAAQAGLRAVSTMPAATPEQFRLDHPIWVPVYETCIELGLPLFMCMGVPGPRVQMAVQQPEILDEVCAAFPKLVVVIRHGCEPWQDVAIALMEKWPNLYYSTSAFAPKHYPAEIIYFANNGGADKVLYAGYYPMGLSLERIMVELDNLKLDEDVWPKFLNGNATRLLGLASAGRSTQSKRLPADTPARW